MSRLNRAKSALPIKTQRMFRGVYIHIEKGFFEVAVLRCHYHYYGVYFYFSAVGDNSRIVPALYHAAFFRINEPRDS